MPVLVSHSQIQKVKDALASVQSNDQAAAAVGAALAAAHKLINLLAVTGGPFRARAAKDLGEYRDRVKVFVSQLAGQPTGPVGATWAKAKEQVMNLYMLAFTLESTMSPGENLGDGWGPAISGAVDELPQTVGKAAKVVATAVQTVVRETAKVGGSLVWGVFSGAWPLVLIVAAIGVGYLVLRKKIPVLP